MRLALRARIAIVGVACVAALTTNACGDDLSASQKTTGPYAVGTTTATFVDTSRAGRVLETDIWYPAVGAASDADTPDAPAAPASFPLIVFSHGQAGEPHMYQPDFHLWTQAGYVVAAPRHPLTVKGIPGGPQSGDIVNQPEDLSFVIDKMGERHEQLVDLSHVAVAGHSSGAITAMATGLNTCCRDDRVDAVILEAPLDFPFNGTYFDDVPATPVLFINGDADSDALQASKTLYARAKHPKNFLTIAGGDHSAPYRSGPPDYHLVGDATLAFADHYLKDRGSQDTLAAAVAKYPFGTLQAST